MTSGMSATNSFAYLPMSSALPAVQRMSIRTLLPAVKPKDCKPCKNAARRASPSGSPRGDELYSYNLLDWQVGWLRAHENLGRVDAGLTIGVGKIVSVAHQAARGGVLAYSINRGHRMAGRQRHDLSTLVIEKRVSVDEECAGA
jgi:hypothetical protein